jgi:hypothetical protein
MRIPRGESFEQFTGDDRDSLDWLSWPKRCLLSDPYSSICDVIHDRASALKPSNIATLGALLRIPRLPEDAVFRGLIG